MTHRVHAVYLLLHIFIIFAPNATSEIVDIKWGINETLPITTSIYIGDIVNWIWDDDLPHSIKSTDASFASSTIISGFGYNYSIQFWTVGTFPYECGVHSTLSGIITVQPIADAPTLSPTILSTSGPDLSVNFAHPRVVQSGRVLPAVWALRLEVRMNQIFINDDISFYTRSFCVKGDCRAIGPTIKVKAGDVVELILENYLGNNNASDPLERQPNTTRLYLHGLHTAPTIPFEGVEPGTSKEFPIDIPTDHATGVHWYSSDTPGAAELHAMNGLVGAIYVEPQRIDDVPFAIQNAAEFFMVVTKLVFVQEVERTGGDITQACSYDSKCDPNVQAPLCTGDESSSPYNPYRLYTMDELNTEAGSLLNIDASFNGTDPRDLLLINGRLIPTVNIVNKNPSNFKIINAATGSALHLTFPVTSHDCTGTVIAVDGVYLQARWERDFVKIPPGGRVDIEIFCFNTGTYTVYESGMEFLHMRISQSSSNRPPVKDSQLEEIRRPPYLADQRMQNSSTVDRYFTVDMSLHRGDSCSYKIGYGMNCLNETVIFDENSSFPQYEYDCTYVSWAGSQGGYPFDYLLSNRFVSFIDARNQWTIYGGRSALQTFSMEVNHFQIISMSSNESENDWFQVGQFRDTLPLVDDAVTIRFFTADFEGEHTFQTNFMRHKELGVKDSFLVVNFSTFQALTESPTQAPTDTPDDGIIQVLSFQMRIAFAAAIITGVIAITIYLVYFTESRSTVFPDKVM